MRAALSLVAVVAATLLVTSASADVGPTPRCDSGTHHEYLYGHHCVADGSHLEQDPNGGYKTVSNTGAKDADKTVTPPVPTPTASASAAPAASASPAASATPAASADPGVSPTVAAGPPPTEAPPRRGCGCDIAGVGGSADWLVAAAGFAVAIVRRRRAR